MPFDPVTKRTEATVTDAQRQDRSWSPRARRRRSSIWPSRRPTSPTRSSTTVDELAGKGYRALGVARSEDGGTTWSLLGILPMFDPPRDDSKATIDLRRRQGRARSRWSPATTPPSPARPRASSAWATNIMPAAEVVPEGHGPEQRAAGRSPTRSRQADGFARVFPEHKYAIVKALQERGHLVAMTGDGVNDAPALKQADCGTAVSGATDAARGAAALILTAPGLSVINSAIDEARRIFGRITSYTIYRVALTMDIMFLVVLSTIFLGFQPLTADHDRRHVAARRRADHDHRLRQHAGQRRSRSAGACRACSASPAVLGLFSVVAVASACC